MLLYIDDTTGKVTRVDKEEQCSILQYCDDLKEELEGWLKYKSMETTDTRYTTMSTQEFQHALVMLDNLFTAIKGKLNPTEQIEFDKFKTSMK